MHEKLFTKLQRFYKLAFCGALFHIIFLGFVEASPTLWEDSEFKMMQSARVSGKVTSEDSPEGLPGVNVVEKGTSNGTVSDINGNYSLELSSENATIIFSSIGYETEEVEVGSQSVIDIYLIPNITSLGEVVVVGYGSIQKEDVTGSVGSMEGTEVQRRGTTSVIDGMQGLVAGVDIQQTSVRPGSGFNINIRGINSLNTDTKPLFVVDGIVTDDIDFLNPQDIDRIDILKDASSTAIYGSRGSSGVVIITTKNADNVRPGKINVNYDGFYGVKKIARMPDFMDGREFAEYRASAYWTFNRANNEWGFANDDPGTIIMSHTDGVTGSPVWANRLYEEDYTDFTDLATRDGSQQNHYVNISGSGNTMSYNVGLGYQNEKGNFLNEEFDRYNLKLSINHRPSDIIEVGATGNIALTESSFGSGEVIMDITRMAPFFTPYNPDGSPVVQPGRNGPENHTDRGMTGTRNPLATLDNITNSTRRYDILATAYLQISPIEGLDLRSTISPRYFRERVGFFQDILQDTYLDREPAVTIRTGRSDNAESLEYTWDNMINYRKMLGVQHSLSATGVFSVYRTRGEALRVETNTLPYSSEWYNLFSGNLVQSESSSGYTESTLTSYLGRVNYDYANKYLVTASLRYDGASRLADKWAAFPSFALAWRISEESFLNSNKLNDLKLRVSYGYSGTNQGVGPFATNTGPNTSSILFYNYGNEVVTGFSPGTPVNPNLTWEKTREFNVGFDFGLFESRIYGSVDLYDKLSDELLLNRNLAIESGVESMQDNIGSVNNRGIEVALNTVNVETDDFQWTTNFTFASNKNKIVSIYNENEDDIGNKWFIGEPVNVIHDYRYMGVWTQAEYDAERTVYENYTANPGEAKVQDTNGDNFLNADDKVVLGSPMPKWIGGVTSSMRYKNFDLSFNIFTRQGMLVDDQFAETYIAYGGRSRLHVNYDYYMPAGVLVPDWDNFVFDANGYAIDITTKTTTEEHVGKYPVDIDRGGAFYANNGSRLPYYKDASFVKVKNITLGYTFNQDMLEKAGISRLRIYANVLNPFVFTQYEGYDPEYAETNVDDGNTISNITYQLGVNLQF